MVRDRQSLDGQLLTPSDIGDVNRARVIQAFCDHGPLTRAELARMAGVTRATIGNIVAGLLDAGLIEEGSPRGDGQVGKPGRPLWFGPRAGLAGAVAIVPGTVHAALVNARGEIMDERQRAFDEAAPAAVVNRAVTSAVGDVLPRSGEVLGIGIAVPGTCDTSTGSIIGSGQVPALRGRSLHDAVARRFGLPVLVDNDTRAQALGEKWFGRGRQEPNFASVQTGHGIGVGLVIGGTVLRGPRGGAGEAGHTRVVDDGALCRCGLRGCWETIATLGWLRAEAARRGFPSADRVDAGALADDGSAPALELLRDYAANVAVGLANLMQVLGPAVFILHGDAVQAGETFRAMVEEETRDRVFPYLAEDVNVVLSELDQRAGLLGAAGLVLSDTFALAV